MCDFSLMHFPNRLATEGEELIAYRFSSGSLGLASPANLRVTAEEKPQKPLSFWATVKELFNPPPQCPIPAVCVPPGARLMLWDIPAPLRSKYKLEAEEEVRFAQLSAAPNSYRDAIAFKNGTTLKLQELAEGLRVTVLTLSPPSIDENQSTASVNTTTSVV